MNFRLSAFADEAADSLTEQIEALREAGIRCLELRGAGFGEDKSKSVGKLTPAEAKEIRKRLDAAGIAVSAVGSPFGKIKITDDFAPHFEEFKVCLEVADILGAPYFRMFSFFTGGIPHSECKDAVLERLEAFLAAARNADTLLCHENEKEIYGDTAGHCLELFEVFGRRLHGVYDPANFMQCGEDAYAAYEKVAPYIDYYHIKDVAGTKTAEPFLVPAGDGDGGIVRLMKTLRALPGETFMTLEPHLFEFYGLASLESGASLKRKYTYKNSRESFATAADAMKRCLTEAGYIEKECGVWSVKCGIV